MSDKFDGCILPLSSISSLGSGGGIGGNGGNSSSKNLAMCPLCCDSNVSGLIGRSSSILELSKSGPRNS